MFVATIKESYDQHQIEEGGSYIVYFVWSFLDSKVVLLVRSIVDCFEFYSEFVVVIIIFSLFPAFSVGVSILL